MNVQGESEQRAEDSSNLRGLGILGDVAVRCGCHCDVSDRDYRHYRPAQNIKKGLKM